MAFRESGRGHLDIDTNLVAFEDVAHLAGEADQRRLSERVRDEVKAGE